MDEFAGEAVPVGPLGLHVGQSATRTKTIADADLRAYAEITGDYNPLHFDDAFAAATRFGRRVAQGGITAGLLNALEGKPANPRAKPPFPPLQLFRS